MDTAVASRRLALLGAWGAALTVVVVAASALLRLGTSLDAGGNAASTLPAALESAARIAHRISASAVGLVALAAAVVAWRGRPVGAERGAALAAVVVLTLFLAALGRYTPGYRFVGVTVANAVSGVALACAFAWLRAGARGADRAPRPAALAAALTLLAVLAELGLGTAASASGMQGVMAFEPLHVGLGPVVGGMAAAVAARGYRESSRRGIRKGIVALALAQMALGSVLAAAGGARGIPAAWAHAMIACAMALALAALAARGR